MSNCEKCGKSGKTEKVVAKNLAGDKRTMILCPSCAEQVRELIRKLGARTEQRRSGYRSWLGLAVCVCGAILMWTLIARDLPDPQGNSAAGVPASRQAVPDRGGTGVSSPSTSNLTDSKPKEAVLTSAAAPRESRHRVNCDITTYPLWCKLLFGYIMIGLCTQLPGVAYGHFLKMHRFYFLEDSGILAKMAVGIGWFLYSVVLWPTPFLRVGLNLIALQLVILGVMSSLVLAAYAKTGLVAGIVVLCAAGLSMILARPRGL